MPSIVKSGKQDLSGLDRIIESTCDAIAPSWPLDRMIAVNPLWGWVDQPFGQASGRLSWLAGSSLWMPCDYYRQAWQEGRIGREALQRAIDEAGAAVSVEELVSRLERERPARAPLPLLSDALDAGRDLVHEPAWHETITHEVSQYCASYFDELQADWKPATEPGLYRTWRNHMRRDRSVGMLMRSPRPGRRVGELPERAEEAIRFVLQQLKVEGEHMPDLLLAVLLRIHGWAAWCAYLRWQARLAQGDDRHIVDLLAVRLAWEWLIDDGARDRSSIWQRWRAAWSAMLSGSNDEWRSLWQRGLEIAYQAPLATALAARREPAPRRRPALQAVFCIDVRSEVFRRALEAVFPDSETRGFAGFFGLPMSYTPLGTSATRPQLPGLLSPAIAATDSTGDPELDARVIASRRQRLAAAAAWEPFERMPASSYSLVETLGPGYLLKLVGRSLFRRRSTVRADDLGLDRSATQRLAPTLCFDGDSAPARRVELAERVLRALGLTGDFARLVLLVGHGSLSSNNPQAAGLDCGACCGQSGEANARALAGLLNDRDVRHDLAARGIEVPADTVFLAALHETTTDDVRLFDARALPGSHAADRARLDQALADAGERARAERAGALGLASLAAHPKRLARTLRQRASDWSETRPEWGLAGNASFVVAPRGRTRGLDLQGRAFLHDYDWRADRDGSVLELILTAPMIVTHWINLQYYASTVDNRLFGSGNKVLHNVVGGRIGVFEGNGGDLRIGLARQSLHDGERWVHTPLRLSVFVEAPRAAIDAVVARHDRVRQLLDNDWIHMFRIDEGLVERYVSGTWEPWASQPAEPSTLVA